MAFNPDEYLGNKPTKSSGFDPDAYLGQPSPASQKKSNLVDEPKPSAISRFLEAAKPEITTERGQQIFGPAVSALTTTGGAILGGTAGTFGAGPVGTATGAVTGGGLGYAAGEELLRRLRGAPATAPTQTARDILTGATFEAAGRGVLAPLAEKATRGASRLYGAVRDLPQLSRQRAAQIARESVGEPNISRAREALRAAIGEDVTAAQALARIDPNTGQAALNIPVAQALLTRVSARDPQFFTDLLGAQNAARLRELSLIAGGPNATQARAAREEMKSLLNQRLIPVLQTELAAANIAGQVGPRLQARAAQAGQAAEQAVEDVRRFTAAGERARGLGRQEVIERGFPVSGAQYTYVGGDLARRADMVADESAKGSLLFGEARRFAEAANNSLAAHGLRPLRSETVIAGINRKLSDPKIAGTEAEPAMRNLIEDIQQWTNSGGVIDAWALDSLRKNAVNRYINMTAKEPKQARKLASDVMANVKPLIVDAIEEAGGTGYGAYLRNYARAEQAIAQTRFGGEALKLYQSSPGRFVELVEMNDPKVVEKIFGPGNYNIATQLSRDIQTRLANVANQIKRDKAIETQATAGEKRLAELLKDDAVNISLPNYLNIVATTTNKLLGILTNKVSRETMNILTESAKSAKNFNELLGTLPTFERNKVLQVISDPRNWQPTREVAGGMVSGTTSFALSPSQLGGVTNMNPRLER